MEEYLGTKETLIANINLERLNKRGIRKEMIVNIENKLKVQHKAVKCRDKQKIVIM